MAAEAEIIITAKDQATAEFKKAEKSLKSFGDKLEAASKKMRSIGKKATAFVTLPILGIGAAMLKAASDAEETATKFGVVFSSISGDAEAAAKNLRDNFGLSSNSAKQLLGDTGDLLTGFGFTQESALDLSDQVNQLAVDLASFTNFSGGAEGASAALTKALLGERESVKSLGISILEADVKAKVLENTQAGMTFETERQAKAFATLQLAQEQSKNAIGDFARTQDGAANQMRIFKARIDDLMVSFGEIMLPTVNKIIGKMISLTTWFSNLSEGTKKTILGIAGVLAVAGPLLLLLGSIIPVITAIGAAFTFLAANPIVLIIGAIIALFIAWQQNMFGMRDTTDEVVEWFKITFGEFVEFIREEFGEIFTIITETWAKVTEDWRLFFEVYSEEIKVGIAVIKAIFTVAWEVIKTETKIMWEAIKLIFGTAFDILSGILKTAMLIFQGNWSGAWANVKNTFGDVWEGIKGLASAAASSVIAMVERVIGPIKKAIAMLKNMIGLGGGVKSSGSLAGERAKGGPVSRGKTYLVGERGPELFTPASSGGITPNDKMGGGITIIIQGDVNGDDAAEMMANKIIQKLQLSTKVV